MVSIRSSALGYAAHWDCRPSLHAQLGSKAKPFLPGKLLHVPQTRTRFPGLTLVQFVLRATTTVWAVQSVSVRPDLQDFDAYVPKRVPRLGLLLERQSLQRLVHRVEQVTLGLY